MLRCVVSWSSTSSAQTRRLRLRGELSAGAATVAGVAEGVRRFVPPRPVRVQHDDGRWYAGEQDGWVRWPDGSWRASVAYSVGVGEKYVRSVPDSRVAPAGA